MSETFLLLSRARERRRPPHAELAHEDEETEEKGEEEDEETEEEEDEETEEEDFGVWREEPSRREVEASQRVWMSKIFSRYDTDGGRGDLDRVMAVDSVRCIYQGPKQSLLSSLQSGKRRADPETSRDLERLRRHLLLLSETVRGAASNASVLRMWSSTGKTTREKRRAQDVGEKGRAEKKTKSEIKQNEKEEDEEQSPQRKAGAAGGTAKAQTDRRTEGSLSRVSSTRFASSLSSSSPSSLSSSSPSSLSSSSPSSPPSSSSLSSFCGRRERGFRLMKGLLTAARNRDVILPGLPETYERLEFLGDALIGLLVTEWLFSRFPNFREGPLSEAKNVLLSNLFFARKLLRRGLARDVAAREAARDFEICAEEFIWKKRREAQRRLRRTARGCAEKELLAGGTKSRGEGEESEEGREDGKEGREKREEKEGKEEEARTPSAWAHTKSVADVYEALGAVSFISSGYDVQAVWEAIRGDFESCTAQVEKFLAQIVSSSGAEDPDLDTEGEEGEEEEDE
ncbi:UNVERIFIED_CONTAM: ribonuclease III [Hammondia hammondi]|eukprot:XP_008888460.1 ribonuclease III [Hammondia hammondi]